MTNCDACIFAGKQHIIGAYLFVECRLHKRDQAQLDVGFLCPNKRTKEDVQREIDEQFGKVCEGCD